MGAEPKICHGEMKYYPHIDGIRALAIIPVVLNPLASHSRRAAAAMEK